MASNTSKGKSMANEPSATGKDYASMLKFFYFGGEENFPENAPEQMLFLELHKKAVSNFQAIGEAVLSGDASGTLSLLEKWSSAENFPSETLNEPTEVEWCEKLVKMMDVDEAKIQLVVDVANAKIDVNAVNCAIRDTILRGDISQAIRILKKFYPKLYDDPSRIHYFLAYQHLIELIRSGQEERAVKYSKEPMNVITNYAPCLDEEIAMVLSLLGSEQPLNPHESLLDASQRQRTANVVMGAIVAMGMFYTETLLYYWRE